MFCGVREEGGVSSWDIRVLRVRDWVEVLG